MVKISTQRYCDEERLGVKLLNAAAAGFINFWRPLGDRGILQQAAWQLHIVNPTDEAY